MIYVAKFIQGLIKDHNQSVVLGHAMFIAALNLKEKIFVKIMLTSSGCTLTFEILLWEAEQPQARKKVQVCHKLPKCSAPLLCAQPEIDTM